MATPIRDQQQADSYASWLRKTANIKRAAAENEAAASANRARNAAVGQGGSFQYSKPIQGWKSSVTTPKPTGSASLFQGAPTSEITSGLDALVANYNQAFGSAREANEARYQQLLGITDETTQQRQIDVTGAYQQKESDVMQRLAGLGMSNTTVAPTMQFGIEREKQSALNRTADEMQQTKLGIIERREDEGPDLGSLQSVLAGVGTSYAGGQGLPAMLKAFGNIRSI